MTWSSTAVPGHPPGRDTGLYRRGRNEYLAGVATLGIGVLQQGGNMSERRVAFPPNAPWTTPVRTTRMKPPRDTYVPMPEFVPVAALYPAPAAAPLAPEPASTTPPASVLKPPAPIPPRVGRDIKNEGHVEMPGRTRGETRVMRDALQEYAHRHGVLSTMEHAALVSMLATRESTNKIVRQHSAPKDSPDLPTAHIPDISKPSSVSGVVS